MKKSLVTCFLLVLSLFSMCYVSLNAQENGSLGNTHVNIVSVNWRKFWNIFNNHSDWSLEYNNGSGWMSAQYALQIIKTYYVETDVTLLPGDKNNGTCVKIALNFTAPYTADYRLTFGIDLDVKNYSYREDKYTYVISYQNHTVYFNFTDLTSISGLTITHGIQLVGDDEWFWFRVRRNGVPQGRNIILDPTFGKTDVGATWFTSWDDRIYANQYNLTEAGTVNKICLYAGDNENGNDYRLAIYNSSWSGTNNRWEPDCLMGESANVTATGSGWMNATVNIELQAGEYHIAWRVAAAWGGKRDDGGTSQLCSSAAGQGSPDNNFPNDFPGVGATYDDYACSIFAVYTAGAAGQDLTFTLYENLSLYSSLGVSKELTYVLTELIRFYGSSRLGREYINILTEVIRFSGSSSRSIEIGWTLTETVRFSASVVESFEVAFQDLTFIIFETINLFGVSSMVTEGVAFEVTFILHETISFIGSMIDVLEVAVSISYATTGFVLAAIILLLVVALPAGALLLWRSRT